MIHPVDSTIQRLNNRTLINNREINCVIQWIEIYPADMGAGLHISFVGRRAVLFCFFFFLLFSPKKLHFLHRLRKMAPPQLLILSDPTVVKI